LKGFFSSGSSFRLVLPLNSKWRARTDPWSSIGVNILRDLERGFMCGGDCVPSVFKIGI
jgi:hypothetical protein